MASLVRQKAEDILRLSGTKTPPVDVVLIAKVLGFKVLEHSFPDKKRGMVYIKGRNKAIGVNEKHSENSKRYTIAHELGHYLSGHEMHENKAIHDDERFYDSHFHQEREADAFAAELLMPKKLLLSDLDSRGVDMEYLTERYKVSEQAMLVRLTSLKLLHKYKNVQAEAASASTEN